MSFDLALELAEEMSKDDLAQRFEGSCTVCTRGHKAEFCPFVSANEVCLDVVSSVPDPGPASAGATDTVTDEKYKTWPCHNCKEYGHWKADCRNRRVKSKKGKQVEKGKQVVDVTR